MTTQQLKTQVFFSSKRFALPPDESDAEADREPDAESNRWNHELANFFADGLRAKGFSVTDPFDNEHGHGMEIANDTFRVYLGCGPYGNDDSFTAFLTPSEPTVRKWFRTYPTGPVLKPILAALDAVLADPSITGVRWELP
jgi:hypothetical protein